MLAQLTVAILETINALATLKQSIDSYLMCSIVPIMISGVPSMGFRSFLGCILEQARANQKDPVLSQINKTVQA